MSTHSWLRRTPSLISAVQNAPLVWASLGVKCPLYLVLWTVAVVGVRTASHLGCALSRPFFAPCLGRTPSHSPGQVLHPSSPQSEGCPVTEQGKDTAGFSSSSDLFSLPAGAVALQDLCINQAVVFIEDAVQVGRITWWLLCWLSVSLPSSLNCPGLRA